MAASSSINGPTLEWEETRFDHNGANSRAQKYHYGVQRSSGRPGLSGVIDKKWIDVVRETFLVAFFQVGALKQN